MKAKTLYVQDERWELYGGPTTYSVAGKGVLIEKDTTARSILLELRRLRADELKYIGSALTKAERIRQQAHKKYDRVSKQLDELEGLINEE